ncbi:hypothetical protein [Jatrophihabitans endophyticus]|uniref:hypothetical protein n=1 Tax=Jatrophihabitans endophyticus TaxID=1206085 RepID=UPI001A09DFE8|nr:hypothetical protein [Jatrophihabitans endophyticus]MBE7189203.1 hypothetical protein [Jatrophihabitans endophyticus]
MARGRSEQDPPPSTDTQPEFATVDDRADAGGQGERVRPVKRARLGVVVLTVLVTELVLIAAGANQGVAKHYESYAKDHPSSLLGHVVRSLLVFRWQVSASGHTDLWHTELITVGLVLLLGIVLVPMVVHGPVSWLRAFLASWFTVTVSVVVAAVAALVLADLEESRDLTQYVVPGTPATGLSVGNKISNAVFGPLLSYAFVAGLALGLVVALITSVLVASTRRTDPVPVAVATEPEPLGAPETPQPFFGSDDDDRTARTGYGTSGYGTSGYGTSGYGADTYGTGRYAEASYADSHPYATDDRRASQQTTALPSTGAGAAGGYAAARTEPAAERTEPTERRSGFDRALDPAASAETDSTAALPRVGTDQPPAGATTEPAPAEPAPAEATQAWPAQPEPVESTESTEPAPTEPAPETASDPDSTAAFPLPPDDEDLGHHEHEDD